MGAPFAAGRRSRAGETEAQGVIGGGGGGLPKATRAEVSTVAWLGVGAQRLTWNLEQPCVDVRGSERADGMGAQVRRELCAGSENETCADEWTSGNGGNANASKGRVGP